MDISKPPAPVFVTYFSATLGQGLATLSLYAQAHEAIGASPVPVSAAALVFRTTDFQSLASMIDDLLRQVGWTDPAPQAPSAPPPPKTDPAPAQAPAPVKVRPLPPAFVSHFTGSFFSGMVIVTFFAPSQTEIGASPVVIPVASAAFRAQEAKGLVTMINDLLRKGEMMVQLKDAPTSGMQ
jgi:hypothetical protein